MYRDNLLVFPTSHPQAMIIQDLQPTPVETLQPSPWPVSTIINPFTRFSYFECSIWGQFVGAYPSTETTPGHPIPVGTSLFDFRMFSSRQLLNQFKTYLYFLATKHFGFNDFIGYLLPKADFPLTGAGILRFLQSLQVKECQLEPTHHKLTITSTIDPKFSATFYARAQSAPQLANDVSVYYCARPQILNDRIIDQQITTGKLPMLTTLGFKRRAPELKIVFDEESIYVLSVGLFGALYGAGEHLEKEEIPKIKELLGSREQIERLRTGHWIPLSSKDAIVDRALAEEMGISVQGLKAHKLIVGIHDRPGRDPRYWFHQFEGEVYGYQRYSISYLIAVIVEFDLKQTITINPPADAAECSAARAVQLNQLLEQFTLDGEYRPAFPVHVEQLHLVRKILPSLLAKLNNLTGI